MNAFLFLLVPSLLSCLINGWVIQPLWGWFVAGVFGLPLLTLPQAMGLGLFLGFTMHQYAKTPEMTPWEAFEALGWLFLGRPLSMFILGWIIHWWL